MARKPRGARLVPNIPNHFVHRANNRRRLFSYANDYATFLWQLGRASEDHGVCVHALALMGNHVHVLATPPSVTAASRWVAQFAQRYAQVRNARRGGTGKLFEERYYSKPVDTEEYLRAVTLYIEANPVRAGIVEDAIDYRWSTHALHAGAPERSAIATSSWVPSQWYVALGSSDVERAATYRELFLSYTHSANDVWPQFTRLETTYTRRLLRPNGSRANEPRVRLDRDDV
jgi:putative transposase